MKTFIALDVGGSSIKTALVNNAGEIVSPVIRVPSESRSVAGTVTDRLAKAISLIYNRPESKRDAPFGIGLGFPGPFDYENGISKMKGLGKFESIYDLPLIPVLREKTGLSLEMKFCNDADLYALGEANFGQGRGYKRVLCFCIGTGIGSGFCDNGRLVKSGEGVPENGWIYRTPCDGRIADEVVSASGLRRMMKDDPALAGVKDVYELSLEARKGNPAAKALFSRFGELLAGVILPHALNFKADCVVAGGDVSKSGDLFLSPLRTALAGHNITLNISRKFSDMTLSAAPLLFN